jgi:hypothetical protein
VEGAAMHVRGTACCEARWRYCQLGVGSSASYPLVRERERGEREREERERERERDCA